MVDCRRTLSLRTAATSVAAMAGTRPARSSARRLISQPTSSLLLTAWAAAQTSARSRTASQLAVTSSTSSSRMARHTSALPTLRPLGWRAKSMKSTEQSVPKPIYTLTDCDQGTLRIWAMGYRKSSWSISLRIMGPSKLLRLSILFEVVHCRFFREPMTRVCLIIAE